MRRLRLATLALASVMAMPAGAVITYNADTGKITDKVTYAVETLKRSERVERDNDHYYPVRTNAQAHPDGQGGNEYEADTILDIQVPAGVGGESSVTVMLENMMFGGGVTLDTSGGNTGTLRAGGGMWDEMAVFNVDLNVDLSDKLTINVPSFLIESGSAEGGEFKGTVTVEIKHDTAVDARKTHKLEDVVQVKRGIVESGDEGRINARVSPLNNFTGFALNTDNHQGGRLARLGYMDVKLVDEDLYRAENGVRIQKLVDPNGTVGLLRSAKVEVMGDFSFLQGAALLERTATQSCGAMLTAATDGITNDDDGNNTGEFMEIELPESGGGRHYLCLTAHPHDKGVSIPATEPYTATVFYDYVDNVVPGLTKRNFVFGSLERNEHMSRIGFLSLNPRRMHRVHLTNHGDTTASYMFKFVTEDGVEAAATPMAMGDISSGETVVLAVPDIVAVTGGYRVAAEISFTNADPGKIDVTSAIVNRDSGTQIIVEH